MAVPGALGETAHGRAGRSAGSGAPGGGGKRHLPIFKPRRYPTPSTFDIDWFQMYNPFMMRFNVKWRPMKITDITERKPLYHWIVFGAFLVLFFICYSTTLTHNYGFLDEYYDVIPNVQDTVFKKRIQEGRPTYAAIYRILIPGGIGIEDLFWLRLMGVVGISLVAFAMFQVLVRNGWNRLQSFCASAIIGTTLPFSLYAAWATTSIFPYAVLASFLAFLFAERAAEKHGRERILLSALAILTLFLAITIYQLAAMFFWVGAAVVLLKPEAKPYRVFLRLAWYGVICVIGLALGALAYKAGSTWYSIIANRDFSFDLFGRFLYFIESLSMHFPLLSPYDFFFSPEDSPRPHIYNYALQDALIAGSFLLAMALGLGFYFRGTGRERLLKCGLALALIPVSIAPALVVETDLRAYRMFPAPASLIVIYSLFAIHGYARLWKFLTAARLNVVMALAAIVSAFSAAHHVHSYIVSPQIEELEVMRFPLEQEDLSKAESIFVIRPMPPWESLAPLVRGEFGQTSSRYRSLAPAMVFLLLRDIDSAYAGLPVTSVAAAPNDVIEQPRNSLVVDMRNLSIRSRAYRWGDGTHVPGELVLSSFFSVYMDNHDLYYVKEPCSHQDTEASFFLHVFPSESKQENNAWDNLDFNFVWHGVIYDGKCMAIVRLPDYANAHVLTGQYASNGNRLWEGEFYISSR